MDPLSITPHAIKSSCVVYQATRHIIPMELTKVNNILGYQKLELNKYEELLSIPRIQQTSYP